MTDPKLAVTFAIILLLNLIKAVTKSLYLNLVFFDEILFPIATTFVVFL